MHENKKKNVGKQSSQKKSSPITTKAEPKESNKRAFEEIDDEDGEDASDAASNTDSSKKRGRYKTYTEDEKKHIIDFVSIYVLWC